MKLRVFEVYGKGNQNSDVIDKHSPFVLNGRR